jgi:hypothetical protein
MRCGHGLLNSSISPKVGLSAARLLLLNVHSVVMSNREIVLTEAGIIDRVVANADIAGLKTPRVEARSFAIRTLTYQGYLQQARRRRTGRWHRLMSACLLDHNPAGASYLACRDLQEDQRPSVVEPPSAGIIVTWRCSAVSRTTHCLSDIPYRSGPCLTM